MESTQQEEQHEATNSSGKNKQESTKEQLGYYEISPDPEMWKLGEKLYPDPPVESTMYDAFMKNVKTIPNDPCLGTRKLDGNDWKDYVWSSWQQTSDFVHAAGSGMINSGLAREQRIGIYMVNRAEWLISDYACHAYGLCPVALYNTFGLPAVEYIIRHAEISLVVCESMTLNNILSINRDESFLVKTVVSVDTITEEQRRAAEILQITLLSWEELLVLGKNPIDPMPTPIDGIFTIMYTSGTTGYPKGVSLTQRNALSEALVGARFFCPSVEPEVPIHYSYLPLAHSFDRLVCNTMIYSGSRIGFYSGSLNRLLSDIAILKPTFMVGVPRVFQRVYDKVHSAIKSDSFLKRTMFNLALGAKRSAMKTGGSTPFWDWLVFSKTRQLFGGRIRFIISGSAPLEGVLATFVEAAFCCPVYQGYGLTETFAAATLHSRDPKFPRNSSTVGYPFQNCTIRLVDVPDLGYFSTDKPNPRGEIVIKGDNIFSGYFKAPEMTSEVLSQDGWFSTGDIGMLNPSGEISIIDRKKNIFKLSQGEYVSAENLEGLYAVIPIISQIWVYGDSVNNFLSAVIIPDWEQLMPLLKEKHIKVEDTSHEATATSTEAGPPLTEQKEEQKLKSLCSMSAIQSLFRSELDRVAKERNLNGFEYIKVVFLDMCPFSTENELMSPSFKLRRPQLKAKYYETLNNLSEEYKSGLK